MLRRLAAFASVAALCAAALYGCRGADGDVTMPLNPAYLSASPARDRIDFRVTVSEYREEDATVIEEAWKAALPDGTSSPLWAQNGLRLSSGDAGRAKAVREILKRAHSLRQTRRQLVMAPEGSFDLLVGPIAPAGGLVYVTSESTFYKDFPAVKVGLKVAPLSNGGVSRFAISGFFYTDPELSRAVFLTGARDTFDFVNGGIVMFGPSGAPGEKRLGADLYESKSDGRWGTLVTIEPRLSY